MGYSYSQDEGPRMCFNNAKNWQLGWYADRRATASPLVSSWEGTLVGFAEYDLIPETSDSVVILKVQGDDVDYYVGFNRRTGINSGTVEGGNQVTVQQRNLGTTNYEASILVAKLSVGGSYTISDFAGETVIIEVLSINTSSSPGVASVRVYKDSVPTKSPTKAPTKVPTKAPTQSPTTTAAPSDAPSKSPTKAPTKNPTKAPTESPTTTAAPSDAPTKSPTKAPVVGPDCSSFTKRKDCGPVAGCFWDGGICQNENTGPTTPTVPTAPTAPAPAPQPAPTGGVCSSSSCSLCDGRGVCRDAGCTWSKGNCS